MLSSAPYLFRGGVVHSTIDTRSAVAFRRTSRWPARSVIPPPLARRIAAYTTSLEELWASDLRGLTFSVNPRLARTIARFVPDAHTIELGAAVLQMRTAEQREVLCHEAAHAVIWKRCGRRAKPHGPEWASLMRLAGHQPSASRVRCEVVVGERRPRQRYRHVCRVCHFSAVAAKRMPAWRCPECTTVGLPGLLAIERLS